MSSILVWSDDALLRGELTSEARRLADRVGADVRVVALMDVDENESTSLAASGADIVYVADSNGANPEDVVAGLAKLVNELRPPLILIGATKLGIDVAPRVAERTAAGYGAWAVRCELDEHSWETTATCMIYAGAGLATYRFGSGPTILACAAGTFAAEERTGREVVSETLVLSEAKSDAVVVDCSPKEARGGEVGTATIVVDVGQGVSDEAGLQEVRALASALQAPLGCSRPVVTGREWLPEWLGLSGAKIRPQLCLTVGISGAIQHMIGIRESRVIAAVNNDESAAIFMQADVGVVADLKEFVPILTERLKSRGVRPAG